MNESTAGRSSGQDDKPTPAEYRHEATALRLQAVIWNVTADNAESAYKHLGVEGIDFGIRIALRLRECAREAVWTATQLEVFAAEATPCQADTEDVGRTDDDYPPSLAIVRGDVA